MKQISRVKNLWVSYEFYVCGQFNLRLIVSFKWINNSHDCLLHSILLLISLWTLTAELTAELTADAATLHAQGS